MSGRSEMSQPVTEDDVLTTTAATAPGMTRLLLGNRFAVAAGLVVIGFVAVGLLAPALAPHAPSLQHPEAIRQPPFWYPAGSPQYLLGTDSLGRDLLSRMIYGARVSLLLGVAVVLPEPVEVVPADPGAVAGGNPPSRDRNTEAEAAG